MSSSIVAAPMGRQTLLRIACVLLCLIAGLAGALAWKHYSMRPTIAAKMVAPAAPKLSAAQILAAIAQPKGNSATDQTLLTALEKVRKTPDDANAWVLVGEVLAQEMRDSGDLKFYDTAEMAYQRALDLDPKSVDAMTGLAWVSGGRHLFDQSIAWANRALALDPRNAAAHGIVGDAALELGNYESAFDSYQKMMDARPDLSSWSRGAYLLWLTGNTSKASWLMQKAISSGAPFAENTAWCRAKYATMLFNDGAYGSAEQALKPALTSAPHNTHVLLAGARITMAEKDYLAAKKYFQTMLDDAPNHDALVGLGDLAALQNDPITAEKYYTEVEKLYAADTTSGKHSHLNMAKFYADHDRNLVEALRIAEQSKLSPNVLTADVVAWVYYKNGDQPHAIEAIKRALRLNTRDATIHYHAGMIAARFGDRVSAQKHLQTALSCSPRFDPLQAPIAVATLDQLGSVSTAASAPATPATTP